MTRAAAQFEAHVSALEALVAFSPDHFYLYDRAGRHLYASPAAAQALGSQQDDFIGKTWLDLGFAPQVTERFDLERETVFQDGRPWRGEMLLPTELGKAGTTHDYILSPVYGKDGSVEAVLVTARDITEQKRMEATLQYQALHDALTGLANRTLLHDRLEQSLRAAHRTKVGLALLFLDLVDFKAVNDTVGHQVGDDVLQQLSVRWSGILRASDTLSRIGGDEFVVLLPATNSAGADEIADRLRSMVDAPFDVHEHRFSISVSIGIIVHEGGQGDATALIRQADEAMYRSKRHGDTFQSTMQRTATEKA
jgi:diguanylate cyclase (GGDEF)-like protein/PAS domain S-box-containing protein